MFVLSLYKKRKSVGFQFDPFDRTNHTLATKSERKDVHNSQSDETRQATALFETAVREGWNLEMDWLWLATRVNLDSQKLYCWKQALYINPDSQTAKQNLKRVQKNPGQRQIN